MFKGLIQFLLVNPFWCLLLSFHIGSGNLRCLQTGEQVDYIRYAYLALGVSLCRLPLNVSRLMALDAIFNVVLSRITPWVMAGSWNYDSIYQLPIPRTFLKHSLN